MNSPQRHRGHRDVFAVLALLMLFSCSHHRMLKARVQSLESPLVCSVRIGHVGTIAGRSTGDFGPGTSAALDTPTGIALDTAGNVFVADMWDERIRRIDGATGTITTILGNGLTWGAESLNYPKDLLFDSAGRLVWVEGGGLRRFDPSSGSVSTLTPVLGWPTGLGLDRAGNFLITIGDTPSQPNCIKRVDATTGAITIIAGAGTFGFSGDGGPAVNAQLNWPTDVECDNAGNLYIADYLNHRIRKIDATTNVITTIAGNGIAGNSGDGGPAIAAQIDSPYRLRIHNGRLFITSTGSIRAIDLTSGAITTVVAGIAEFAGGLDIDAADDIYYSTSAPVWGSHGKVFRKTAGSSPALIAGNPVSYVAQNRVIPAKTRELRSVRGLAFNAGGDLYVSDTQGILKIDAESENIAPLTSGYLLSNAQRLAVDANGQILVAANANLWRVDPQSGSFFSLAGTGGIGFSGDGGPATSAQLFYPHSVAIDNSSQIYIGEEGWASPRVRRIDNLGGINTIVGSGAYGSGGDGGPATLAQLTLPFDMAIDGRNRLYIATAGGNNIRRVDLSSGIITTYAGTGTEGGSGDEGSATAATMEWPTALALDLNDNLFIGHGLHTAEHRIRRVDANSALIRTIAGGSHTRMSAEEGSAPIVRLSAPTSLATDRAGNLFLFDAGSAVIQALRSPSSVFRLPTPTPTGLAHDGTSLYVASAAGIGRIYKTDPTSGAVITSFLIPANNPNGLAYDAVTKSLLVVDIRDIGGTTGRVYDIDLDGNVRSSFSLPFRGGGIAFDGTFVYVTDYDSSAVLVTDRSGNAVRSFDSGLRPADLSYDPASGYLWAIDIFNSRITILSTNGMYIRSFDGPRDPGLQGLGAITVWDSELYVAELTDPDPFSGTTYYPGVRYTFAIDWYPATTQATVEPAANSAGWNNAPVTVKLDARDDNGSPCIKQLQYSVNSGPNTTVRKHSTNIGVSTEGISEIAYFTTDEQENIEIEKKLAVRIDSVPPSISFGGTCPATLPQGSAASVQVTVADNLSGVASQSQPNGPHSLATTTAGPQQFVVTATDQADNVSTNTCSYAVTYNFAAGGGFVGPVVNPPGTNTVNAGSTVPMKWSLPDGSGGYVSDPAAVQNLSYQEVDCATFSSSLGSPVPAVSAGGSGLQYDNTTNQFSFNWQTDNSMAGKCYLFILTLNDGTMHEARFVTR